MELPIYVAFCQNMAMTTTYVNNVKRVRKFRGLSQTQLAERAGFANHTSIVKYEAGDSRLSLRVVERLANALNVAPSVLIEPATDLELQAQLAPSALVGGRSHVSDVPKSLQTTAPPVGPARLRPIGSPPGGITEDAPAFEEPSFRASRQIPIYSPVWAGRPDGAEMGINPDPIEYIDAPHTLTNPRHGFGLYVVGSSMEPVYNQGDVVIVHSRKPPVPGDDVLVQWEEEGHWFGLLKRFVSADRDAVKLQEFNPNREFTLNRPNVTVCKVIASYKR